MRRLHRTRQMRMVPAAGPVMMGVMAEHQGGRANWSRRYKANLERLRSGERGKVAEVARELSTLERHDGLSAGERRMLRRAQQLLEEPPGEGEGTSVREPRRPPAPSDAGAVAMTMPDDPQSD